MFYILYSLRMNLFLSLFCFFRTNEAILLALYEAVHLNRNFITVLAQVGYLKSPNPAWEWWPAP